MGRSLGSVYETLFSPFKSSCCSAVQEVMELAFDSHGGCDIEEMLVMRNGKTKECGSDTRLRA